LRKVTVWLNTPPVLIEVGAGVCRTKAAASGM
jgi:hypothetical protein